MVSNTDVPPSTEWEDLDCDGDGITNGQEILEGTDPLNDCDFVGGTPLPTSDCDNDGLTNEEEELLGTDIQNPDSDGDGVIDGQEVLDETDPTVPCDFMDASVTLEPSGDYLTSDCDGDGATNGDEIVDGTDPTNPCDYNVASITQVVTTGVTCLPSIEVAKEAIVSGTDLGNTIDYVITVENTGNVVLENLVLTDTFMDATGNTLTLSSGPDFDSADQGSAEGTLLVGETATYTASFIINPQAMNAGGVSNSVVANGVAYKGVLVSDVSDDGDDFDGNTLDDPTVTDLGCLLIFNEFSPNGDGVNDTFVINCIENYPNNILEVYNRWGNIVYKARGYLNDWDGTSNGRAVINQSDKLPVGTYYYVLDLGDGSENRAGWLFINR